LKFWVAVIFHWFKKNLQYTPPNFLPVYSEKGVMYKKYGHVCIFRYSDSDYAGDKGDRKFTTGYCIFVGGNLVTWKSKKQDVISKSSTEAEYRVMTHTSSEMMWLKNILLKLEFRQSGPMLMFCDNQFAIYIAQNLVFH